MLSDTFQDKKKSLKKSKFQMVKTEVRDKWYEFPVSTKSEASPHNLRIGITFWRKKYNFVDHIILSILNNGTVGRVDNKKCD